MDSFLRRCEPSPSFERWGTNDLKRRYRSIASIFGGCSGYDLTCDGFSGARSTAPLYTCGLAAAALAAAA